MTKNRPGKLMPKISKNIIKNNQHNMKKTTANSANTSSNNSQNQTTNKMNKQNKTAQPKAPKKAFVYEKQPVNPSAIQIHPLLLAAGEIVSNDVFVDFYKEFNYLEIPVITEDGFAITHAADVIAAQNLGLETIDAVVMKNAMQNDVVRFISFKNVIGHGKNRTAIYKMVTYLTEYLTKTPEGKELAGEFDTNKTRTIAGTMVGVSAGTVQNVMTVGNNEPGFLEQIDKGEMTMTAAIKQIVNKKEPSKSIPFESRKKYEDVLFSSKGKNDPAKFNLNSVVMNFEELGELNLNISGSSVAGTLNGQSIGALSQSVRSDYESEDSSKSQHVQSHVFLPVNDRFSIQIIIRDFDQLESDGQLAIAGEYADSDPLIPREGDPTIPRQSDPSFPR